MYYIGIDIGSSSAKTAVLDQAGELLLTDLRPTGWNSAQTAQAIRADLTAQGYAPAQCQYAATGYGRISVPFADKVVTEITCHGRGAARIFTGGSFTVIDIGGQDTKVILVKDGRVRDFAMNDKCAAGTGRFLEVMAAALGVDLNSLCRLAAAGEPVTISSMCTVFAESEVIGLIGAGRPQADIARGVVDSIVERVSALIASRLQPGDRVCLTGGLCDMPYIVELLSRRLNRPVETAPLARFAGALGAALSLT